MASGLDSVLRNELGLAKFPSPLRYRRLSNMCWLGVQQRAATFEPSRLLNHRRLPLVRRCKLATGLRSTLDGRYPIHVGHAVSAVGAPAFDVSCRFAIGARCRT